MLDTDTWLIVFAGIVCFMILTRVMNRKPLSQPAYLTELQRARLQYAPASQGASQGVSQLWYRYRFGIYFMMLFLFVIYIAIQIKYFFGGAAKKPPEQKKTVSMADQLDAFCEQAQGFSEADKRKPALMYYADGEEAEDWIRMFKNGKYVYCTESSCDTNRPFFPITTCRFEDTELCEADQPTDERHKEKILYNLNGKDAGIRRIWSTEYGRYFYLVGTKIESNRYNAIMEAVKQSRRPISFYNGLSVCKKK